MLKITAYIEDEKKWMFISLFNIVFICAKFCELTKLNRIKSSIQQIQ